MNKLTASSGCRFCVSLPLDSREFSITFAWSKGDFMNHLRILWIVMSQQTRPGRCLCTLCTADFSIIWQNDIIFRFKLSRVSLVTAGSATHPSPALLHVLDLPICALSLKLINAVVLLILLTALSDPNQYHLTSAELANDLDVMDDASK